MPTNVIMPQMGESIFEGTITKWLKKVGDRVARDEPLFEISTDKVDSEIPSPAAGVLSEILVQEGKTVQINTVVAVIDGERAETIPAAPPAAGAAEPAIPAEPAVPEPAPPPPEPAPPPPAPETAEPAAAIPVDQRTVETKPLLEAGAAGHRRAGRPSEAGGAACAGGGCTAGSRACCCPGGSGARAPRRPHFALGAAAGP